MALAAFVFRKVKMDIVSLSLIHISKAWYMRQSEGAVVMKYINQLEHRDIPYEHNLDHGGVPEEKRNVAAAGCGPSCLCMMVDALTLATYELTDLSLIHI